MQMSDRLRCLTITFLYLSACTTTGGSTIPMQGDAGAAVPLDAADNNAPDAAPLPSPAPDNEAMAALRSVLDGTPNELVFGAHDAVVAVLSEEEMLYLAYIDWTRITPDEMLADKVVRKAALALEPLAMEIGTNADECQRAVDISAASIVKTGALIALTAGAATCALAVPAPASLKVLCGIAAILYWKKLMKSQGLDITGTIDACAQDGPPADPEAACRAQSEVRGILMKWNPSAGRHGECTEAFVAEVYIDWVGHCIQDGLGTPLIMANLPAGNYRFTALPSAGSWTESTPERSGDWHYNAVCDGLPIPVLGGPCCFNTPDEAFLRLTEGTGVVTTSPFSGGDMSCYIEDSFCSDNQGGVRFRMEQIP